MSIFCSILQQSYYTIPAEKVTSYNHQAYIHWIKNFFKKQVNSLKGNRLAKK